MQNRTSRTSFSFNQVLNPAMLMALASTQREAYQGFFFPKISLWATIYWRKRQVSRGWQGFKYQQGSKKSKGIMKKANHLHYTRIQEDAGTVKWWHMHSAQQLKESQPAIIPLWTHITMTLLVCGGCCYTGC